MKHWIYTKRTNEYRDDDQYHPDLGGLQHRRDVQYSVYTGVSEGKEVLTRVSAPEPIMYKICRNPATEVWSDRQARDAIDGPLEGVDQPDVEVDQFLRDLGYEPDAVRRRVQEPARGAHVLQNQDRGGMDVLAKELAARPCSGRCRPGNPCDVCADLLDGRGDTHANTFEDLRSRI